MHKIEILGRFANRKKKTKEDKEEDYVKSLLNKLDEDEENKIEVVYDPMILDLDDVRQIIRLDRTHTQLNMFNNAMFIAKVPYSEFVEVYQKLTGQAVTSIKFRTAKEVFFNDINEIEQ